MTPPRDHDEPERTRREVRSADPSLSPETNRRLTQELRDATGDATVEVPADRPMRNRERHGEHSGFAALVADNRDGLVITAAALVVIGAIVSLSTGTWIVVVIALVIDLLAGAVVAVMLVQMTRGLEHPSPELTARLQEEGVADPDSLMTDLVEDFSAEDGHEGRSVEAGEDPEKATSEQRSAQTPSEEPSRPTGPGDGD